MRQNATESDDSTVLSRQQIEAVELLLRGVTVTAAADEIGVSRSTVHRWMSDNSTFIATLNAGKKDLRDSCEARLFSLADSAIDSLSTAMEEGDGRLALALLKELGLVQQPRIGATSPEEVEEDAEADQAVRGHIRMLRSVGIDA